MKSFTEARSQIPTLSPYFFLTSIGESLHPNIQVSLVPLISGWPNHLLDINSCKVELQLRRPCNCFQSNGNGIKLNISQALQIHMKEPKTEGTEVKFSVNHRKSFQRYLKLNENIQWPVNEKEVTTWVLFYEEHQMIGAFIGTKGFRKNSGYMVQKMFLEVILIFLIPSYPTSCESLELILEFSISLKIILFSDFK